MKNWAIVTVVKASDAASAIEAMQKTDVVSVKKVNVIPQAQGTQFTEAIGFHATVDEQDFDEDEG